MDSGKLRRVALAAGLLFCFVAVTGCLFLRASQARFEEEAKIMAKLTETDPQARRSLPELLPGSRTKRGRIRKMGKSCWKSMGIRLKTV